MVHFWVGGGVGKKSMPLYACEMLKIRDDPGP